MKVCVIGTGPSGLTTIKQLLDEGHDVTCFEKNDNIGGIWYRNSKDAEQVKAFDSLVLTISAKLMAFSDFMVEKERVFYTHRQYMQYLADYADRFGLRRHVSLSSTVHEVRKVEDGRWRVSVTQGGQRSEHLFDAVALCTGPFQAPNMAVTDLDKFTGRVVHSSKYRNNESFRGERVLVVGMAESGADVVREISDVASACTLSIRSYSFLLPRLLNGVDSTDSATVRGHHYETMVRATDVPFRMKSFFGDGLPARLAFSAVAGLYGAAHVASNVASALRRGKRPAAAPADDPDRKNNLGEPMHPPKVDVGAAWTKEHMDAIDEWNRRVDGRDENWCPKGVIFCKNVSFIPNIVNGKIDLKDCDIDRIRGRRVHFKDGTSQEFDAIVLCTGFVKDFSMLGGVEVEGNNVRNLFKHAFHPDHGGRLAMIGFVRPYSGGIPICAEMQARYFALLCSGKRHLPPNVRELIREDKTWEEAWSRLSPRHTEAIPSQIFFLDSLAKEIGCLMPFSELVRNPRLFVRQWFYSFNQACYRLRGPHSMPEYALDQIMSEQPGPLGNEPGIVLLSILSMLPHFVHPKSLTFDFLPGWPTPPKMYDQPRPHGLTRRDASARPSAVGAPSAPQTTLSNGGAE